MFLLKSIYLSAIIRVYKESKKGLMMSKKGNVKMNSNTTFTNEPSATYVGASWTVLIIGVVSYLFGLWNTDMQLSEKGFYFSVFLLALFSAVTLQKTVRDRAENIPVTNIFLGICWVAFFSSIALLVIGLFNASMLPSEKGFYGISFVLSLFAVITVQKNVRDMTDKNGETNPAAFPNIKDNIDTAMDVADVTNKIL